MAHSLIPAPAPAPATATPFSIRSSNNNSNFPACRFQKVWAKSNQNSHFGLDDKIINRRTVAMGLVSTVLGLNVGGDQTASAAARRPPPPPEEKKDPNVSGVTAKVLASKRRKEAMKEAMAKQRERGKPVN